MSRIKAPLKYHGGKHYLAKKIIAMMPPHTRFLEACSGSAVVTLNKSSEGVSEYINDINRELMNLWGVLKDADLFKEFHRMICMTPFGEPIFQELKVNSELSNPERAVNYFVRMRQSRQGLGLSFATPTSRTRRGMNENVSAWLGAIEGLPEIHERLRRVEILCCPAVEAIKKLDSSNTLVYCDPPYMHETRSSPGLYSRYEMSDQDHLDLLTTLSQMQGKFILSGYPSDLYKAFESQYQWGCEEIEVANSASNKKTKEIKKECLWYNYAM